MDTSRPDDLEEDRQDYWNTAYAKRRDRQDSGENWLEAHDDILIPPSRILDMGCGTGATTGYLISRGHTVIATDISRVALSQLRSRVPAAETMVLDFSHGLPWADETFDHVVADLCLHYFDIDTTRQLVKEILRVLKKGGYLLARVNSVKDVAHGYGAGRVVEPNYFLDSGHYKRFFDRGMVEDVFDLFLLERIGENCIDTASGEKHLFEVRGKKRD